MLFAVVYIDQTVLNKELKKVREICEIERGIRKRWKRKANVIPLLAGVNLRS